MVAADIDPEAVRVTRFNVARNGVTGLVQTVLSEGCRPARSSRGAWHLIDLITANILARPWCRWPAT